MMKLFFFLLLSLAPLLVKGQVDVSAGSFTCYPCGKASCGFSWNTSQNKAVSSASVYAGPRGGTMTCTEIQQLADQRQIDPETCSYIQQNTMASADPCLCKVRSQSFQKPTTSTTCETDPPVPYCNLCGSGKYIGNPNKVFTSGLFAGATCQMVYNTQLTDGNFGNGQTCSQLQSAFQANNFCGCTSNGQTATNQCTAMENPSLPAANTPQCFKDSECCGGGCRYRLYYRKKVCTTRAAEVAGPQPGGAPAPTPSSSNRPPTPPSSSGIFNSPPGTNECSPSGNDCPSSMRCSYVGGAYASYKCIGRSAGNKSAQSYGNGGGAGAAAKKGAGVPSPPRQKPT